MQNISRLDKTTITTDSLTAHIHRLMEEGQVHGMALTLFNDNHVVYQKTFGYKNQELNQRLADTTNMYGASLSKAVFGVLVMQLIDEGVLDLDKPLQSYLPQPIYNYEPLTRWHDHYADLSSDTLYHKITARMCLSHTTGFPNWRWFETDQKLRVNFEPGSRFHYSGEGFVYLQVVLEKMLGKGLEELAQEKLFIPLGMDNTSYQWNVAFADDFASGHNREGKVYQKDTDNEPRSGSTLETTQADYSLFLEKILQHQILTDGSWNEMFSQQIRLRSLKQFGQLAQVDSTLNDDLNLSYGLGWGLLDTPHGFGAFKEGHGDGFQHYSILFPEVGTGILIMTNSDNGEGIFKELLEVTISDVYTPWEWQNYIPYSLRDQ